MGVLREEREEIAQHVELQLRRAALVEAVLQNHLTVTPTRRIKQLSYYHSCISVSITCQALNAAHEFATAEP